MSRVVALVYVAGVLAWRLAETVVGMLHWLLRISWTIGVLIVLWLAHGVADVIDYLRPASGPAGEGRPR